MQNTIGLVELDSLTFDLEAGTLLLEQRIEHVLAKASTFLVQVAAMNELADIQ